MPRKTKKITTAEFSALLQLLYSADPAGAQPRWQDLLHRLVQLTASDGAALLTHDLRSGETLGLWSGYDPAEAGKFIRYYSRINPWMPRESPALTADGSSNGSGSGSVGAAAVIPSESFLPLSRLQRTEFYTDWGKKNRVVYSTGINLGIESGFFRYLSLNRGESSPGGGPMPDEALEFLNLLVPHLQNAVRLETTLAALGDMRQIFEQLRIPVFLLDRDACIIEMSPRAERLASASSPRTGPIRILDPLRRRQLQLRLAANSTTLAGEIAALASTAASPYRLLRLQDDSPTTAGIDSPADQTVALLSKAAAASLTRPDRYLLAILEPPTARGPAFLEAARLYRLTPAEARFVQTLVETGALDLTIEKLGITRNTARTQMASIFTKTGTRRQGQVIQLFSLLMRVTHLGDDGSAESP